MGFEWRSRAPCHANGPAHQERGPLGGAALDLVGRQVEGFRDSRASRLPGLDRSGHVVTPVPREWRFGSVRHRHPGVVRRVLAQDVERSAGQLPHGAVRECARCPWTSALGLVSQGTCLRFGGNDLRPVH